MIKRASGVLMHISSLPGEYGIGTFGKEAKKFIDFLSDIGCKYWQVLPFGPTDHVNSPYASISAFAGNRNFIDVERLYEDGLITKEDLEEQKCDEQYISSYDFLRERRMNAFYKAYHNLNDEHREKLAEFKKENKAWVVDYALYIILKEAYLDKNWYDWPDDIKFREPETLKRVTEEQKDNIDFIVFMQYLFYTQWHDIRKYANDKGVQIIGDLPMYVAMESSDVWSDRHDFDLDEDGRAKNVAGVPPDYFSEDGQKWGQALYDWDEMKRDGYSWWMRRLETSFELFDMVRIDHFRAFSSYWAVPFEAETAKEGEWIDGPKMELFGPIFKKFGRDKIIAEDLGIIDDGVRELLKETKLPGMRIMQFGFMDESDNLHLPHNYPKNSFAYTGTHDNDTLFGWLFGAEERDRNFALDYANFQGHNWSEGGYHSASCRAIINTLWQSHAEVVVVPIQDLCGFGTDTKMNKPGTIVDNWIFRITEEQLNSIDKDWIRKMNHTYKRFNYKETKEE